MSERSFQPEVEPELPELAAAVVEGRLDAAQAGRLRAMLHGSPEAKQFFVDYLDLHVRLEREHGEVQYGSFAASNPQRRRRLGGRLVRYAAAAAIVLCMALLFSAMVRMAGRDRHRPAGVPVATLIDVGGAVWARGTSPGSPGTQLAPGFLHLASGTAEVEFFSGARVTLTGPCEFGLNSPMRGLLRRGEITALVPAPAHGFTVGGPGCAVIDLGTAFTMRTEPDGRTSVRVLQGRVELRSGNRKQVIHENQAFALEAGGPWKDVTPAEKPVATSQSEALPIAAWFPLDGDGADASGHGLDLVARWASPFSGTLGPMDAGSAAAFPRIGRIRQLTRTLSRSELEMLNTTHFTLEAWVRDPDPKTAGDHSDHAGILQYRDHNRSQLLLSITHPDGGTARLELGYHIGDGSQYRGVTTPALTWKPGVWYHVAAVYDANTPLANDSTVIFYRTEVVPGRAPRPARVATLMNQPDITPLTLGGALDVGGFDGMNWRAFGGSLAGVRYIDRCMSEAELRRSVEQAQSLSTAARRSVFHENGEIEG